MLTTTIASLAPHNSTTTILFLAPPVFNSESVIIIIYDLYNIIIGTALRNDPKDLCAVATSCGERKRE